VGGRALVLAVVLLLAVGLAVSTLAAVHYHHQVVRLRSQPLRPAPAGPASLPPILTSQGYDLDTGKLQTTVYLTTAASQGVGSTEGQVLITARISGGTPGIRYRLVGGDCQLTAPPNTVWAQATADATGAAFLSGATWTLPKGDQYFLTLDPWPPDGSPAQRLTPGMEGEFVLGQANSFVGHVNLTTNGPAAGCYIGP
jgi:hypothetical protein